MPRIQWDRKAEQLDSVSKPIREGTVWPAAATFWRLLLAAKCAGFFEDPPGLNCRTNLFPSPPAEDVP